MSMEDARLDHLTLRIETLERVLGAGDYEPAPDERTALVRLADAERDIAGLEAAKMQRESDLTWDTVRDLCMARNLGASAALTAPQVKAIADLIESEWGKQLP
jgi:hypothetical protein